MPVFIVAQTTDKEKEEEKPANCGGGLILVVFRSEGPQAVSGYASGNGRMKAR